MHFWCLFLLMAASPDRPPLPEEWGYRPAEGAGVSVNPPSFSWAAEREAASYILEWSRRPDFSRATTVRDIKWSVYTHNAPLAPGKYVWRYRIALRDGQLSGWSKTRAFTVPASAVVFPKPAMDEMRKRIPRGHPRLFVFAEDLAALRPHAAAFLKRADALLQSEPTPEPTEMGSASNPKMVQFWWSNRMQTLRACQEAETVAFAWLLTRDPKYQAAARRRVMHLASWNPDGPTNWRLNDEAAMPILHRLARAYDWAYDALTPEDREKVRAAMRRRGSDAWKGGQIGEGAGHLNRPYNSHGNRAWHKLAEVAIAGFDEIPEAERWLEFALDKFYGAYPVWADDDGGWHEGLSYWAGYMVKITWWLDAAAKFGVDGFKKPFFAHIGDYALYTAPPGSPDMGFGDLSYHPPSSGMAFVRFFAQRMKNPYWTWWADQWNIREQSDEPVLGFLWGVQKGVAAAPPAKLPPSKVFRGTGVAILNSTLLNSANNVQVRFKSSPMGRQSHGHDPHNSFTLNAYGDALLVNNVYRDLYGSPFHKGWCWSTRGQNALLVDGEGQKPHSADPMGRLVKWSFQDGLEYVVGDAAAAYEGRLKRYLRHIYFVKPDVVVLVDDVQAARPATFQWMLHGLSQFQVGDRLKLERQHAGVLVDYLAPEPLRYRQWDGYDPPPNQKYLSEVKHSGIPNQWHVEASTAKPAASALVVTVLRPYRKGREPREAVRRQGNVVRIGEHISLDVASGRVRNGKREWKVTLP